MRNDFDMIVRTFPKRDGKLVTIVYEQSLKIVEIVGKD